MNIAVITSTIGSPHLRQALDSVRAQSQPAQHYVFVDGREHWAKVEALQADYPEVIFTFLPMNTGGKGWTNSHINAIAPFLVKEDVICYLDDDNYYSPEHCATIAAAAKRFPEVPFFYTLRTLIHEASGLQLADNAESLGFWRMPDEGIVIHGRDGNTLTLRLNRGHMVDTNCMALRVDLARATAQLWCVDKRNDMFLFQNLLEQVPMFNTAKNTVFYRLRPESYLLTDTPQSEEDLLHIVQEMNQVMLHRPWLNPTLALIEEEGIVLYPVHDAD